MHRSQSPFSALTMRGKGNEGIDPTYNDTRTQKIPRNQPKQEVKDGSSENNRTRVKDIEEVIKKEKNIPCSWIGRNNIIKMCTLPRSFSTLNGIPLSMPWHVSQRQSEQTMFLGNEEKSPIPKGSWKKKYRSCWHPSGLPDLVTAVIVKKVWDQHQTDTEFTGKE